MLVDNSLCFSNHRVLAVTSGKGGVGKSTLSVCLAAALCKNGKRVAVIDCDEGLRCLDLMLGMSDSVVYDLGDILCDRCDISAAIKPVDQISELFLIAAPQSQGCFGDGEGFKKLIAEIRSDFDFIIIDSPAGMSDGFRAAALAADEALVVVTPDPVCIRDAGKINAILAKYNIKQTRMVINRYDRALAKKGCLPTIDNIIDATRLPLGAVIPDDKRTAMLPSTGKIPAKGKGFAAFDRLAKRLLGQNIPLK